MGKLDSFETGRGACPGLASSYPAAAPLPDLPRSYGIARWPCRGQLRGDADRRGVINAWLFLLKVLGRAIGRFAAFPPEVARPGYLVDDSSCQLFQVQSDMDQHRTVSRLPAES